MERLKWKSGQMQRCVTNSPPFHPVQTVISNSSVAALPPFQEQCIRAFRVMLQSRALEDKLASLYKAGRLVGGVYLGKGQEAYSAALGVQLTWAKDVLGPFIRDQAARIAFGEPLIDAMRTYFGSARGPMRGRDGNVHRGRPKEGLPAMISHIGSMVPVVSGMLFARRLQGRLGDSVGAVTLGEGGTSTGAFHEGVNMAAVERLPLIVAVTNNQFSYSTVNARQFACDELTDRAKGYGIKGYKVDGTDLVRCLEVLREAVTDARKGGGPQLIVATTLRLTGHGEHDDASYIPDAMKASAMGRDCMKVAEAQLLERDWVTGKQVEDWKMECRNEVEKVVAVAMKEAGPDPFKENWRALSTTELSEGLWTA